MPLAAGPALPSRAWGPAPDAAPKVRRLATTRRRGPPNPAVGAQTACLSRPESSAAPPSHGLGAERVAGVEAALGVAHAEPLHPGFRRPVGPGLGVHAAGALLDPVVADGGRRLDGQLDVLVGELGDEHLAVGVLGGRGGPGPHAGVAVRLQLQAYRVALRALLGLDPAHGAEEVLDVVAVLVGDHVGLDEAAVRPAEL